MKVLTLSGWTQSHLALEEITPSHGLHLDYYPSRNVKEVMEKVAPHASSIRYGIGWSLGGWLLKQAVSMGVLRLEKLVLIAPPVQFVQSSEFLHAMDAQTFDLFYRNYRDDPERTAERFSHLLVKGDKHYKTLIQNLILPEHTIDKETWHPWLDVLAKMHHQDMDYQDFPPTLILHGKEDNIIPYQQSEWLAKQIKHSQLILLPDCAHAPHLHNPKEMQGYIEAFLAS